MTKKLEQISKEQAKKLEEKKEIEYIISAHLGGPGWVHTAEDYRNTVLMATDKNILEKAEYFQIETHENGVMIVPEPEDTRRVHSILVNYFKNADKRRRN